MPDLISGASVGCPCSSIDQDGRPCPSGPLSLGRAVPARMRQGARDARPASPGHQSEKGLLLSRA
eukprot:7569210-Pyramimonas_sp.AAC.1